MKAILFTGPLWRSRSESMKLMALGDEYAMPHLDHTPIEFAL